jgi:hypothetical protein
MPQEIKADTIYYRLTEADVVAGSTKDGSSSANATATITRNPDIGAAGDAAATDTTGNKTLIGLIKGIFNRVPILQFGAGNVTTTTQRITLAQDGPTVATLTGLLNATTLATPATQTLTFTIASGTSVSNYLQLTGRSWLIILPAMTSANLKIRVKNNTGDTTGNLLHDDTGNPHELLAGSARNYSSQATAFLAGAIGSHIAFERYTDATTPATPANELVITLKAVV